MKINPEIFKAYDIRGAYPKDLDEEAGYLIGRAYVKFLNKKDAKIVVGRDNRLSSDSLFNSLVKGLTDQGANVIDIGLSTTPLLYFSVAYFNFDGGINITASHNPIEDNGFKLVREKAIPIGAENGIYEIRDMALAGNFNNQKKGKMVTKEVLTEYIKFNISQFNLKKIKPLKIIVDTANAVPGVVAPKMLEATNCNVKYLFLELDGHFPNHIPNTLKKENLRFVSTTVREEKADLGIAFDGDGDRIVFIDQEGEIVDGDLITAFLSEIILKDNPKEKIIYDIRSSNVVEETIRNNGGIPIIERIGHAFIKERMRKENALFAGELSGHYYHRSHFFCECPFFILFKVLEIISQSHKNLSELIAPFKKYFTSGEINFPVKNKEELLKELEKKFGNGKISKLDGLRIDYPDWWFLTRPSNTEPVLRLVVEAKTKELMEEKTHLLSDLLHG